MWSISLSLTTPTNNDIPKKKNLAFSNTTILPKIWWKHIWILKTLVHLTKICNISHSEIFFLIFPYVIYIFQLDFTYINLIRLTTHYITLYINVKRHFLIIKQIVFSVVKIYLMKSWTTSSIQNIKKCIQISNKLWFLKFLKVMRWFTNFLM